VCPFGISTAWGVSGEFYLNSAVVYIDDTMICGTNLGPFLEKFRKNGEI